MEKDVRRYFQQYMMSQANRTGLQRTANELYRGGVTDMETLCDILDGEPEKLLAMRNIGESSMTLAQVVCAAYRREHRRGDAI